MIEVPETELYGMFQNQLKFQERLPETNTFLKFLPPIDVGTKIRKVFGTLNVPENTKIISLDTAKAAYSYKKDALDKALFFPEEGDSVYYFRVRPISLLGEVYTHPSDQERDFFLDFKNNLENFINEISNKTNDPSKKIVLGILVPFFLTGAIQRENFFKDSQLALYGDWTTIDVQVKSDD